MENKNIDNPPSDNQNLGNNLSNPLIRTTKGLSKVNVVKMNTKEEELEYLRTITLPTLKKRIDSARKNDAFLKDGSYDQIKKELLQVQNRIRELESLTPKTPVTVPQSSESKKDPVITYAELKGILFTEIKYDKRKKDILIEAYLRNPSVAIKKVQNEHMQEEAIHFLNRNKKNLQDIYEQVSMQFFRHIRYEKLLEEYYEKTFASSNKGKPDSQTIETQKKTDSPKTNKEHIPESYYNYKIYSRLVPVVMHKNPKIQQENIRIQEAKVKHIMDADHECGYLILRTYNDEIKWAWTKNSKIKGYAYTAIDHDKKLLLHCYSENYAHFYRFYMDGEQLTIGGNQHYLEKMIRLKNPTMVTEKIDISEYLPSKTQKPNNAHDSTKNLAPDIVKTTESKTTDTKDVKSPSVLQNTAKKETLNSVTPAPPKRRVNIQFKDFVVRRNIFKCMHNKHTIEDIDAIVKVMNKNAEIESVTVPAGYCKQCRMYFIMESTYQQLRKKGIVVFRAIDEKNYLSQNYLNGKLLAQESVLKQFGYSVSQTEGLSETRRHKILSVLVDNHIMTKSEIISYLDFFINQRKSEKYAMAVAKWTIDRNYIRNYRVGEYSKVGVIYKNY